MTAPRRIHLREWERALVGPLTEQDLAALGRLGGRLEVEAVVGGHLIWSTSYVGMVRLPTLEVHVAPKLAGGVLGLVRMLEWSAGLDALEGRRDASPLLAFGGDSLVDLLGLLLVQAAEAVVRRGLIGDYVEEDEALPAVRGRILARRQLLARHGRVDRVWCRHDELRQDVDENRLLALGLAVALRRCRDHGVLRRAQALLEALAAVCDPGPVPAARDLPAIDYHRLNAHYRRGHELARLLVEGDQVRDLLQGDRRCFAFLLDMNRLFERFIERLLRELGRTHGVAVSAQARDTSIIRDSRGEPYASVRPDLLLTWPTAGAPGRRLAVDAKYKPYERGVGSGDLYQAFLYAFAYATAADASAVLLYPSSDGLLAREELYVRASGGRGDARITAVAVPIARVLEELKTSGLAGPLAAEVWEVVGRGALEAGLGAARPEAVDARPLART